MQARIEKAKALKNLVQFNGKILIVGMGCVGKGLLPLLFQLVKINPHSITVIDMKDCKKDIEYYCNKGVTFKHLQMTKQNYKQILSNYGKGDFFIDCAWNIYTLDLLKVCAKRGIMYCNSSIEEWDPYSDKYHKKTEDYTLYQRHMELRQWLATGEGQRGYPSMLCAMGANPGFVSILLKKALLDIARAVIKDSSTTPAKASKLQEFVKLEAFNLLAMTLGVKVIHISERDTQIINDPKKPDEFVNTWSCEGLREEGAFAPAELGYGTHEKTNPSDAVFHKTGDRNQICLKSRAMNAVMHSYVWSGHITGYLIRHDEAFSISDRFSVYPKDIKNPQYYLDSVRNKDHTERVLYRPTCHYVYRLNDSALASMQELASNNFVVQSNDRILYNEIISGSDELGLFIMGDFGNKSKQGWFCGSLLDINEARQIIDPKKNSISATNLQICSSVIAGIIYCMRHPNEGFLLADDLEWREIYDITSKFWGPQVSGWVPVDWKKFGDMQFNSFRVNPNLMI